MKYIPGSAEIIFEEEKPRNVYEVYVECDANDGDCIDTTFEVKTFSELDILMIAYLKLHRSSIPRNWQDAKKAFKKDYNYPFGGSHVVDNERFDPEDWSYELYGCYTPWLESYASEQGLLLFAGMCDQSCHSIEEIDVTYYNDKGESFLCKFPNLGELFDSEEEFITYIQELYKREINL